MRNDVVLQKAVLRQPFLFLCERKAHPARLISERITRCLSLGGNFMENGENAYRRYLDGDDGGITEIIRLYKDGLIFYINGFVRDILTAEELAEETFFRLAVKKPKFSGKSSFKTWLYTVGRNAAFDYLRKNGSGREISVNDCERLLISGSAENVCLKEERKQLVCTALSRLKPSSGVSL